MFSEQITEAYTREKLAVHVWFDSMRRGLNKDKRIKIDPFRGALPSLGQSCRMIQPLHLGPVRNAGGTVERDRPRHRQRGRGTPAAAYCFLSQTAVSGFRIDDGLVAAVVWTGTGT